MDEMAKKQCDNWPNRSFIPLTDGQWNGVGSVLMVTFFIAAPFHLLSLVVSVLNRKVLLRISSLPEIALILADLGVLGLHPFSGSTAFARKWIWGQAGCQLYSFFGFFFGTFQLLCCSFVTFARFKELKASTGTDADHHLLKSYIRITVILLAASFFWSMCPVFGWASYNLTPVGITCTIDWTKNDTSYVTFVVSYAIFALIIPMMANVWFMFKLLHEMKLARNPKLPWARKNCVSFITFGCCFGTYFSFTGYAYVCLFCVVNDPKMLSITSALLPPIMSKMASVINVFFFVIMNPTICAAIRKMFGFSYDSHLLRVNERAFSEGNVALQEIKGDRE